MAWDLGVFLLFNWAVVTGSIALSEYWIQGDLRRFKEIFCHFQGGFEGPIQGDLRRFKEI